MRNIAIHMGLNSVDATHYNGWLGTRSACENDARDMSAIARTYQFETTVWLARQATCERFLRFLAYESGRMVSGDVLIVTFAGHGAQVIDRNSNEPGGLDQAWVL